MNTPGVWSSLLNTELASSIDVCPSLSIVVRAKEVVTPSYDGLVMSLTTRLMRVPAEIFEAGSPRDILIDEETTVAKMVAFVPATALTLTFPSTAVKLAGSSTCTNPSNRMVCSHVKFNSMVLLAPASYVLSVIVELVILPGTRTT